MNTWITVREAAERLAVSDKFIRARIAEGCFTAIRINQKHLRVDEESFTAWVQGRRVS